MMSCQASPAGCPGCAQRASWKSIPPVNATASVSLPMTTNLLCAAPAVCPMMLSITFCARVGSLRRSLTASIVMAQTRPMLPAPLLSAMFESITAKEAQPRTRTSTPALDFCLRMSLRICVPPGPSSASGLVVPMIAGPSEEKTESTPRY